jgi:hypothetical protein
VPLFAVEEIQIEVAVAVSRSGAGGINIQVFSLGAGVSKTRASSPIGLTDQIYQV